MRLRLLGAQLIALSVAGCAGTATDTTQPLDRACTVENCFFEREVRDFEVIDQTTLVVYVGNQRCAFQIELRGTFCDLTFAPEIFFRSANDFERSDADSFGIAPGATRRDLRICSGDLQIGVDGGVFTENSTAVQPTDRFGNERSQCQISTIESVTDDELVELYVSHGVVAPPPPMGSGQIEVGEQEAEVGDSPTEGPSAEAERSAISPLVGP